MECDEENAERERPNGNFINIVVVVFFCLFLSTRPFSLFFLYSFAVHSRKEKVLLVSPYFRKFTLFKNDNSVIQHKQ
jgi:hypothetical protein